jgi:glycosyltransferase involved in cell wall biosynthesis
MNTFPKVTFIIPTLNESGIINTCLSAIRTQNYPQEKIEILVVDGGSTDATLKIAQKYNVHIVKNPYVFQEPGKTLGSKIASGKIFFYLDADNILASKDWVLHMTKPEIDGTHAAGFLPQTVPPNDSPPLNRYLGFLCTDPFTWFVYGHSANPSDFEKVYKPIKKTLDYTLFQFPLKNTPLFGYAQGTGCIAPYAHGLHGGTDDLLAGIALIKRKGIVAYVPNATVYHYHVTSFLQYIRKYTWRTRNNLYQDKTAVGLRNRVQYLSTMRKIRTIVFFPYALSIVFPFIDSIVLSVKHHDWIMLLHVPATCTIALVMIKEILLFLLKIKRHVGNYE